MAAENQSTWKVLFVGVAVPTILGVFGFFGPKLYELCCVSEPPALTASSVRILRVDPNNRSTCTLHDPVEIMDDGTALGLIGTDYGKSAVVVVVYPDGTRRTLKGIGTTPIRVPRTNIRVSAASLEDIAECEVRVSLSAV